jgi:anthranilate phosphoribosyltransferase
MSVQVSPPSWFAPTLAMLLDRQNLSGMEMCEVMNGLLSGACGDVETTALLVALSMKGETVEELAAAAAVLRELMIGLDLGRTDVLDTCGTGGDGCGTFNISTATAFVVAAAGVPVVKHGNRAISSRSGSADVLASLGVTLQDSPRLARLSLEKTGMAFCLAPHFHPALRHVGSVRSRLGFRTIFNCLGPLANPAGAEFQLLGVGRLKWLDRMAWALARLQTGHAFLVCGLDGMDEVSLAGATLVREVRDGTVTPLEWTPDDFGLPSCPAEALLANDAEESADIIRSVLSGKDGPAQDIVLANAAAALLVAERVSSLPEGVAAAREAIRSGLAAQVLADLIACSRTAPE